MKRRVILAATLAAVTCGGSLRAHHSISTIDTSTPVWVKGTVVRYEIVNPHTMVEVEETTGDGQVKRWTVEGPALFRFERMDLDKSFLSAGDVVEVCGFTPKRLLDPANPNGPRPPFIHGHLLVKANGQRSPWGSYGKMENCVRPGDETQSWVQFLNANQFARILWCNRYRTTVPTIATSSALVDEINRLMARCRQIGNVAPESRQGAQHVWARRALSLWRSEASGTLRLTVELPIEEGELIARAIDCAVAAGEVAMGVEPDTTAESKGTAWRAQQADALVAVAKAYLDSGGAADERSSTRDHYQVVVHVDEQALREGAGRSDLPLDTVKRLTCDGNVITMVDDTDGHPLDVGRKQRTVSTALKRALYARDRGCSFPGCDRTRYLDAHHLEHWADGGETNLPNLTLLCTHHHRALHEGGFQAERDAHGALRFRRADGRAIPRCGYRLEDFTDDGVDDVADDGAKDVSGNCLGDRDFDDTSRPSREGFRTTMVQRPEAEVREPQGVYAVCRLTPRRPIKPAA